MKKISDHSGLPAKNAKGREKGKSGADRLFFVPDSQITDPGSKLPAPGSKLQAPMCAVADSVVGMLSRLGAGTSLTAVGSPFSIVGFSG